MGTTIMSTADKEAPARCGALLPSSELDSLLTIQLIIGWAGESGEVPRLGWWRSNLASEFGGEDLFKRLLPHTWRWAALQGAREAARRRDRELRAQDHDPDRLVTIFSLGFEVDERIEERLQDLKHSNADPATALLGLHSAVAAVWDRERFGDWVRGHGETEFVSAPAGRRLKGSPPPSVRPLVEQLVAALWPLADSYPLPHFRKTS
jgi:hypothetical protein